MSQPNEIRIEEQIQKIKQGTQYVTLLRPATVGGGIIRLSDKEQKAAVKRFEASHGMVPMKFVPASGAATRMFKRQLDWIQSPDRHQKQIDSFFERAEEFAFFDEWLEAANRADVETFQSGITSKVRWLELLVSDEGLGYASMPKGLLKFHAYDVPTTPIFEHLKEAMAYAVHDGKARVHFTISSEHREAFDNEVAKYLEGEPFSKVEWEVSFSYQDERTHTIAVDAHNNPLDAPDGMLKRPGGHGALIHNLNALEADLVFIKNIDNVAHGRLLSKTVGYKKALAGILLELREDLQLLSDDLSKGLIDEVPIRDLREKWKIRIPKDYQKLKAYLSRPIRVCGMVKNEGEPGGGPFFTLDRFTGESLQIVEQAQIDRKNSRQLRILSTATHFNPVDLVCCIKDLEGKRIDLTKYVDDALYFIADKTLNGQKIKALEWPGLWNGGMAHWITIFVEVPQETFNPVKEVGDLLRPAHLPE